MLRFVKSFLALILLAVSSRAAAQDAGQSTVGMPCLGDLECTAADGGVIRCIDGYCCNFALCDMQPCSVCNGAQIGVLNASNGICAPALLV